MNHAFTALTTAATFVWLGMILAISFLEAPLKFRAPGVTIPLGLGIGRIVFRALNRAELALAACVLVGVVAGHAPALAIAMAAVAVVTLLGQLVAIRPGLNRRSDRVLAGETLPRSRAHLAYVGTELVKLGALIVLGITALR